MGEIYTIYKHINNLNGKVYIGKTGTLPKYRWSNGSGYSGNKLFHSDIKEFGWENFTHEILYEGLSCLEAAEIEDIEIIKHKSYMIKKEN